MSEPHLNALTLMYVYRYIKLDYDKMIYFLASKYPWRMVLILPKETE